MQRTFKFICCSAYDFTNKDTGERISGIKCQCFDPEQKQIVSVKTDRMLNYNFGDDIEVDIVPNGRYVSYKAL